MVKASFKISGRYYKKELKKICFIPTGLPTVNVFDRKLVYIFRSAIFTVGNGCVVTP